MFCEQLFFYLGKQHPNVFDLCTVYFQDPNTVDDWKADALDVLARRMKYCDVSMMSCIIKQLNTAKKWKDRLAAALIIVQLGPEKVCTSNLNFMIRNGLKTKSMRYRYVC